MKRVVLFILTNLAVVITLSVVLNVLGIAPYLTARGINVGGLLVFAAIFGMGGAFISLAMSKWIAKMSTGAQVITQPSTPMESWLLDRVGRLARQAGIGMPEVAIYESPEPNAFATGMSKNSALVAVSSGLLAEMREDEAEAVLGHEITHVANGDMVTLALVQGVLNTFVIFLARIIGYLVDQVVFRNDEERGPGMGFFVTYMIAEVLLGILASIIVAWFSRQREFRADAGGANLAGRNKMISALTRLMQLQEPAELPAPMKAFGINGGGNGFARLFMTHPPLEERIAALQAGAQAGFIHG